MNTVGFAREIEKANRRLVELRRAIRSEAQSAWAESALAELSSALEELKVAEEELASQNEELADANAEAEHERHRYRELFLSAPFGQLVTDLKGTIGEANRAAADLLGMPAAGLAGKPLGLLVALDDRDRFSRWVAVLKDAAHDASVCAECGGTARFEMQTADRGRMFPCEVTAAPLVDRTGRIASIRWCLRDITDQERARSAERLMDEARRKDEFLAVLAHELRNPLAAITLAADILTGQTGDPARKRWAAEVVERHADQLHRLVDDLLDVSRVSHGKITLQAEEVDLREVVGAALESCQAILEGKGHQVSVSLPDGPVMVDGDGPRLRQVLTNLIDNAAKYTPSGGRVEIELAPAPEGDRAMIAIRDSGIGIPAGMVEQIFGAFEQVDGSSKVGAQGLGLGLALVRQLVALHGGSVRAASDGEGLGASFTVELPALATAGAAAGAAQAEDRREGEVTENGHRILIVDDNADAAELLAETLRRAGYAVELAFDGKGGIDVARQAGCQVALIDLGLPDLDGFEVCRALKDEQPAVRVVALTGYSDSRSRARAHEAGFDRFLVKPLDPHAVVAALAELVGARD